MAQKKYRCPRYDSCKGYPKPTSLCESERYLKCFNYQRSIDKKPIKKKTKKESTITPQTQKTLKGLGNVMRDIFDEEFK